MIIRIEPICLCCERGFLPGEQNITAAVTGEIIINPAGEVHLITEMLVLGSAICPECEEKHG